MKSTGTVEFESTWLSARAHVVDTIRQWIADGILVEGDLLPSERVLADQLKVARGTVRTALLELQEKGVIEGSSGRRKVVSSALMPSLVSHSIAILTREFDLNSTDRFDSSGWEVFIERGALDAVFQSGLHGLTLNHSRLTDKGIKRLIKDRPAGIVFGRVAQEHINGPRIIAAVKKAGIPIVLYGNSELAQGFDHVYSDHAAGAEMLTKYLIGRGCKRIVSIMRIGSKYKKEPYWISDRNKGYYKAMSEAGLQPVPPVNIETPLLNNTKKFEEQFKINVHALAGSLIKILGDPNNRPDAIMLASDGFICTISAALELFGIRPGQDILIAGYDNYYSDIDEQKFYPAAPVATVDKRNTQIGRQMVELLLDRINNKLENKPQTRIVEPELIVVEK